MTILEDGLAILGHGENNTQNLELLLKYLDRLVPFVGAGLSRDFGYPGWGKLIKDLADESDLRPQIDELLKNSQFEEAAEKLATDLPNLFDDTLRRIFDHNHLSRPLQGAVRHVAYITRGLVLTTNFDRVLEAAFEDAGHRFAEVFPGSHIHEASRAIQLGEPFLLKLHGDYRDSASRVLTLAEYEREYGSPDPEKVDLELPLPRVLRQVLGAWPLLFLGCSLNNDRTTRVMAQIAKSLSGAVHFALLSASDNGPDRRRQLYSWNIRPALLSRWRICEGRSISWLPGQSCQPPAARRKRSGGCCGHPRSQSAHPAANHGGVAGGGARPQGQRHSHA